MKTNSSKMLFYSTMIMGIMMSISSSNWIMIWCGLEISLVSFIPIMMSSSLMSSESTIKYFIIQSISSSMLMLAMLIMIMKGDYNYDYMLMAALMIKMGVAPFQNWVLTVIEGLKFNTMILMLTMNKIAPLVLTSYLKTKLMMIIMMTTLVGSIMGLNQNSIKKMIGYSSIFNMGFIMSVIKENLMWISYMLIYSILIIMLIKTMGENNKFINQMMFQESLTKKMSMWLTLMSMGGMPPMMGFTIKFMVIMHMISMKMIFLISIVTMSSLMVMFFYLRMAFTSTMQNMSIMMTKIHKLTEKSILITLINLMTLPMILLLKNM